MTKEGNSGLSLNVIRERHEDKRAVLLRCAYPYGKSQTWLPNDLYKVAAKLDAVGIKTDVVDLNLESMPTNFGEYDHIGIGVIGAPYVPGTIQLAKLVINSTGKKPLVGGPGVEYLSPDEFQRLYGESIQIRNDKDLSAAIGRQTPSVFDISINGRIKEMNPELLEKYLRGEFGFFVSQGCKYACDFCAASRTRDGQKVNEQFSGVAREDLAAICEKANDFGIKQLTMYLSSLDLFQNPKQFRQALQVFSDARDKYGIDFNLRGLSRVDSFLNAMKSEPQLYEIIPRAGLQVVGFGVDGTTQEVWKSQHKGNKKLSDVDNAFETCASVGIKSEALMVMGFHDQNGNPVDTKYSLTKNVEYSISRAQSIGVVARPHVAKDMVPGNNGWKNPAWATQRQRLLDDPRLFRNLDFVALASELTHPNEEFRNEVNEAYLDIVKTLTPTGHCVTSPLIPYKNNFSGDRIADVFNMLIPFDR